MRLCDGWSMLLAAGVCIFLSVVKAHKYHVKLSTPKDVRLFEFSEEDPSVSLLCAKGYFIDGIAHEVVSKSGDVKAGDQSDIVFFKNTTLREAPGASPSAPCSNVAKCLGYQACLFKFSIVFCQQDPLPERGKVLRMTVVCKPEPVGGGAGGGEVWHKVLYITHPPYSPGQPLHTVHFFLNELAEADVFNTACRNLSSAVARGFKGRCRSEPEHQKTRAELWRVVGRAVSRRCRSELRDVYCSYQYDARGLCVPPLFSDVGDGGAGWHYSFPSLPRLGRRPASKRHEALMSYEHRRLLPARLGFVILGYKQAEVIMDLVRAIYSTHHFYVIHIDRRALKVHRQLNEQLAAFGADNVRLLPRNRSFVTSWGSYDIVRAELEGMEELLRLGLWDFVINLSYADLPLRNIDDIAFALAPYRGMSFASVLKMRTTLPNSMGNYKSSAYAYHNCDGYLYKVVLKGAYPDRAAVVMSTQWVTFSYSFISYLLSEGGRRELADYHFNLQTMSIPDEGYFHSMILSSSFKSSFVDYSPRYVSGMYQTDVGTMSRKMNETDLRGQGPADMTQASVPDLKVTAWKNLFARKFASSLTDPVRRFTREFTTRGFYSEASKYFTDSLILSLSNIVLQLFTSDSQVKFHVFGVPSWRVLPKMIPDSSSCRHLSSILNRQHSSMNSLHQYHLLLELNYSRGESPSHNHSSTLRALINPESNMRCFTGGHLRALYVTLRNRPGEGVLREPRPVENPISNTFYLHFYFEKGETQNFASHHRNSAFFIAERGNFQMKLNVQIINPDGKVYCDGTFVSNFQPMRVLAGVSNVSLDRYVLPCSQLYHGNWTVLVSQQSAEIPSPRMYTTSIYVSSRQNLPLNILKKLWKVIDVTELPLQTSFYDIEDWVDTKMPNEGRTVVEHTATNNLTYRTELKDDSMLFLISVLTINFIVTHNAGTGLGTARHIFSKLLQFILVLGFCSLCSCLILLLTDCP